MVWSDLPESSRLDIISRATSNPESVENIALEYGIKSSSLSRKLRQIRSLVTSTSEEKYQRKIIRLNPDVEKKVFVFSDTHFPYGDKNALEAAIEICAMYEPGIVIGLGDSIDAYHFSRFSKMPESIPTIQREIDPWMDWAERLTDSVDSDTEFYLLRGNHDNRIPRSFAMIPGLSDLVGLDLDGILGTKELGWNSIADMIYLNPTDDVDYPDPDLIFFHGDSARKWSGSSVRGMTEKYSGVSSMVGHAHRTGVVTRRTSRGIAKSYEVGCLCSMEVEYDIQPDWTHSVMVGVISKEGFDFSPVVIDRGSYYLDGRRYSVKG
jgi:predicted phosphodiesterase